MAGQRLALVGIALIATLSVDASAELVRGGAVKVPAPAPPPSVTSPSGPPPSAPYGVNPDDVPEAMTFTYKNDHFAQLGMDFRLIYATGLLVKGIAAEFRLFVEQNKIKDGAVVILESDGGSVAEALSMGRIIRQMGFDTEVKGCCVIRCGIVGSSR